MSLPTITCAFRFSRPHTILSPPIATGRAPRASNVRVYKRSISVFQAPSVKSTAAILALLSPRASAALDRALRYERVIYDAAVVVHDRRCVEHLGSEACSS